MTRRLLMFVASAAWVLLLAASVVGFYKVCREAAATWPAAGDRSVASPPATGYGRGAAGSSTAPVHSSTGERTPGEMTPGDDSDGPAQQQSRQP